MRRPAPAAILLGSLSAFVAAVDLVRLFRPLPLLDPDPSWALPRLVLGLAVAAGTAIAGGAAAGAFHLWASRTRAAAAPTPALGLSGAVLAALAAAALLGGAAVRFAGLSRLPPSLWIDDLSLIAPSLSLAGSPADFANSIRPAPYGVAKPYGSVGVLYLEAFRASLRAFGTTIFGVRFLSAAAGVASIATAWWLGRALLPRGGAALAAILLSGLRWSLLMSRWGWNAIVLAPAVDVAAILLLRARSRKSAGLAAAAGLAAGLAAHLYLAGWVAAAALFLLAAWPLPREGRSRRPSPAIVSAYVAAFAIAVSPLFLFARGRVAPYFARASDHNVVREMRWAHSPMPAFAAAADSIAAPWFKPDPFSHHDLPGRTRLGWLLGIPVALGLARAFARPEAELSAFLLCHAAAALAASVAGGHAGVPNGYRFVYLAGAAAVAGASGLMILAGLVAPRLRRASALAVVGLAFVGGAFAVRDALFDWPARRETFDGFHGQDTLIARAALRWRRFGPVDLRHGLEHSSITVGAVLRYGLDPERGPDPAGPPSPSRSFRIAAPDAARAPGERAVERVRDAFGRDWAVVLGRRSASGTEPLSRPDA
ncbi:MAG: glycosyltransferase family 39 protein [Acidobacteriota bacterium]